MEVIKKSQVIELTKNLKMSSDELDVWFSQKVREMASDRMRHPDKDQPCTIGSVVAGVYRQLVSQWSYDENILRAMRELGVDRAWIVREITDMFGENGKPLPNAGMGDDLNLAPQSEPDSGIPIDTRYSYPQAYSTISSAANGGRMMKAEVQHPGSGRGAPGFPRQIRLRRDFWGHKAGTKGKLHTDGKGKSYIKMPGSPRAYVKESDAGDLFEKASDYKAKFRGKKKKGGFTPPLYKADEFAIEKANVRSMQVKLLKNGTIMHRVVGKGPMFTWSRQGTLQPGETSEQWVAKKAEDGWESVSKSFQKANVGRYTRSSKKGMFHNVRDHKRIDPSKRLHEKLMQVLDGMKYKEKKDMHDKVMGHIQEVKSKVLKGEGTIADVYGLVLLATDLMKAQVRVKPTMGKRHGKIVQIKGYVAERQAGYGKKQPDWDEMYHRVKGMEDAQAKRGQEAKFAPTKEARVSEMRDFVASLKTIKGTNGGMLDDWTSTADSGSAFVDLNVSKFGTAGVHGRGMHSNEPFEFEVKPQMVATAIKKLAKEKGIGINSIIVPKKKYVTSSIGGRRETFFDGYNDSRIQIDLYPKRNL